MSAAAAQAAPAAPTSLDPMSLPSSSASNRQYQSSPQPPSRDAYYGSPTSRTSPAASSSRPSPGRSNAAPARASRYESSQRDHPASSPARSSSTTPRQQQASTASTQDPSVSSHLTSAAPPAARPRQANAQQQHSGPPIPPPPRTSSSQPNQHPPGSSSGAPQHLAASTANQRTNSSHRPASSRAPTGADERGRKRGAIGSPERQHDDSASRSRRQGRRSPRDGLIEASPGTQASGGPSSAVRMQSEEIVHPSNAVLEASNADGVKVIGRVVIDDPVVDYDRERARLAEAHPSNTATRLAPVTGLGLVGSEDVEDGGRSGGGGGGGGGRGRQEHSSGHPGRKDTRFGDYMLGRTLGEGEFGKVKMGWKQDGGVQVAIKLIRRESLGTNPSRLPKINREITILSELSHPNIVRLHEMVETDRYIGIILEYASGGELFDYILHHRYLKDPAARRLFAQLVSGVGYLHKKGIVHRDLKLENLLLDRNKNIIITDFGFANTFDPTDELGDEVEYHVTDKDFVKRMDLGRVREHGFRRGDLMQTSCGSPCYAAPELVVTDSLYTGRKVDVWSCGVILYAMLAGYLPFDDDPANPEGDNINLLYKYIVTTPLTFPEYVTPHARDLLRRILVADPRKRADLFEVARHSWLSEYAHVVSFITSSTTTTGEISNTTVTADHHQDPPLLARSASVREPVKSHAPHLAAGAGLSPKQGNIEQEKQASPSRPQRDTKRRTVQLEYVAPSSETPRGGARDAGPVAPSTTSGYPAASPAGRTQAQDEISADAAGATAASPAVTAAARSKATGQQHSSSSGTYYPSSGRTRAQQISSSQESTKAPPRPGRAPPRSASDSTGGLVAGAYIARPSTGGSMTSTGSRSGSTRLPSRGSYSRPGQPSAPTVAPTNAQASLAQPTNGRTYVISNPIPQTDDARQPYVNDQGRVERTMPHESAADQPATRAHKRSNTVGGIGEKIFGRSGSIFGGRSQPQSGGQPSGRRGSKAYPPTSMTTSVKGGTPRQSMDSRRSSSYGVGRAEGGDKPKRFSFLPSSFSLKHIGGGNRDSTGQEAHPPRTSRSMADPSDFGTAPPKRAKPPRPGMAFGRGASQSTDDGLTLYETVDDPRYNLAPRNPPAAHGSLGGTNSRPYNEQNSTAANPSNLRSGGVQGGGESSSSVSSDSSRPQPQQQQQPQQQPYRQEKAQSSARPPVDYPPAYGTQDEEMRGTDVDRRREPSAAVPTSGVHRPAKRNFTDVYESGSDRRYPRGAGGVGGNGGGGGAGTGASNSAARRVMEFFRLRGKPRAWD